MTKKERDKKWRQENPDYQRKWRETHPEYQREWRTKLSGSTHYQKGATERARRHRENHPDRARARGKVTYAILTGKLIRPDKCSVCSTIGKVQADHADYSRPLDVTWVCYPCHVEITQRRRKISLTKPT